ncbi:MAG TPA: GIY-YIG nuclease family protein [Candidatus Limnocylindria bacterium]|nr:GIY-YIG nuclease family protein [Candidatus Limnocylindria bacterium]
MYYLYILKSQIKEWYYVGITDDKTKRLNEHNSGKTRSTKAYRPFDIVYAESYNDKAECRKREILIKKNHALKKSLIPGLR